jgi:hypothetical protein
MPLTKRLHLIAGAVPLNLFFEFKKGFCFQSFSGWTLRQVTRNVSRKEIVIKYGKLT